MNPLFYIKTFAWLSIVGLGCLIFIDYWPIIVFVTVMATIILLALRPRRAN